MANRGDLTQEGKMNLSTLPDIDLLIPEVKHGKIQFEFDGVELYMEMELEMGANATYEIDLISLGRKSIMSSRAGFGCAPTIGIVLSADQEIHITNGFHLKLEDGMLLKLPVFGDHVSEMDL